MNNRFRQVTDYFSAIEGVEPGRMFGSDGLKINRKVFSMQVNDKLVVKLPSARIEKLLAENGVRQFDPGHGRLMKEWLEIEPTAKLDWLALAKESFHYVSNLK